MAKNAKPTNSLPTFSYDGIASLFMKLSLTQAMADRLNELSHQREKDPIYWKRFRSTSFACNKQRKGLASLSALTFNKSPWNEANDTLPIPPNMDWEPSSFASLHAILGDICGDISAIRMDGKAKGGSPTFLAYLDGISNSMAKQAILLDAYKAQAFGSTTIKTKAKKA